MFSSAYGLRWVVFRLLDGDRQWGERKLWAAPYGARSCRLRVYPPGISVIEHHLVRASRGWFRWGIAVWLWAALVLGTHVVPWLAIAMATSAYARVGWILLGIAEPARSGSAS